MMDWDYNAHLQPLKDAEILCICSLTIFDVSCRDLVSEKDTNLWKPRISDAHRPQGSMWT